MIKGISRRVKMLLGGLLLACFSMGASAAALLGDGDTFTAAGQDWQDGGWAGVGAPFTDTATFILSTPLTIKVTFSTNEGGGARWHRGSRYSILPD